MEFYCGKIDSKVNENTCLQNQISKYMKECRRFCEILYQETSKQLFNTLSNTKDCPKPILFENNTIYLSFHKYLNIHIDFYGYDEEAYIEIDCGKYGSTHYHPSGSEVSDDIIDFINGSYVVISKLYSITRIIKKECFKKYPYFYLFGAGVKIITKDGCFTKNQFLSEITAHR